MEKGMNQDRPTIELVTSGNISCRGSCDPDTCHPQTHTCNPEGCYPHPLCSPEQCNPGPDPDDD